MNRNKLLVGVSHDLATIGPLVFFVVATIAGYFRAGYDPIAHPISALALGPDGWVQTVNFALLAASLFAFALVLKRQFPDGVASSAAPTLVAVMTLGVTLAALFPMDSIGASTTTMSGRLHLLGGFLVFPLMPVVPLVLARRFGRDTRWRPYFRFTLGTGLSCLATIIFFLVFVGPPGTSARIASGLAGLTQRVQLVPFLAWIALVSRRAHQVGAGARCRREPA